jgi:hypothetical protein
MASKYTLSQAKKLLISQGKVLNNTAITGVIPPSAQTSTAKPEPQNRSLIINHILTATNVNVYTVSTGKRLYLRRLYFNANPTERVFLSVGKISTELLTILDLIVSNDTFYLMYNDEPIHIYESGESVWLTGTVGRVVILSGIESDQ